MIAKNFTASSKIVVPAFQFENLLYNLWSNLSYRSSIDPRNIMDPAAHNLLTAFGAQHDRIGMKLKPGHRSTDSILWKEVKILFDLRYRVLANDKLIRDLTQEYLVSRHEILGFSNRCCAIISFEVTSASTRLIVNFQVCGIGVGMYSSPLKVSKNEFQTIVTLQIG